MKSDKIQRGIQSRHMRAGGDAPKLGRVIRLRDREAPGTSGRSRRSGRAAMASAAQAMVRRRVILMWSLTFTLVTLLVIGGFVMFWLRSHRSADKGGAGSRVGGEVRKVSQFVSPSEGEALERVKEALAIRDPGVVADSFHLGQATPAEVVEFLSAAEERDGKIERMSWLGSMDVEGLLLEGVLVVHAGKAAANERLAFLVPDEVGVWKVDFEAFARISRPPWRDLLKGSADRSQVRVFVAKDSYYNGPFRDESRWVCYAMASPEAKELLTSEQELLRGYCKAGSPQAKAMERIFKGGGRMNRATLEIHRVEGADFRQFEITRVFSHEWVLAATPLDDKVE